MASSASSLSAAISSIFSSLIDVTSEDENVYSPIVAAIADAEGVDDNDDDVMFVVVYVIGGIAVGGGGGGNVGEDASLPLTTNPSPSSSVCAVGEGEVTS